MIVSVFLRKRTRMVRISLLLLFFLSFLSCKDNTPKENNTTQKAHNLAPAEAIANQYGLEHWDKVKTLSFTFNVDRGENHFERSYSWEPKTGKVTYKTASDTLTFIHNKPTDSLQTEADKAFVNDKYWLLSPFQMVWDKVSYRDSVDAIAPISKDTLQKLTIVYGDEGGYTPGDAYDFYFTQDYTIKEWAFRKGNQESPSLVNTWNDIEEHQGIRFTTKFQDSTGNFQLYFTNIEIK